MGDASVRPTIQDLFGAPLSGEADDGTSPTRLVSLGFDIHSTTRVSGTNLYPVISTINPLSRFSILGSLLGRVRVSGVSGHHAKKDVDSRGCPADSSLDEKPQTEDEPVCCICMENCAVVMPQHCAHKEFCHACMLALVDTSLKTGNQLTCPVCRIAFESNEIVICSRPRTDSSECAKVPAPE